MARPRGDVQPADEALIRDALEREGELRSRVRDAASHGASIRALAELTGKSTNTVARWLKEPK